MALPATSTLTAWTRNNFIPLIADNIYNSNPVFIRMRKRAMAKDGGPNIEQPVLYNKPAVQRFSGFDVLNIAPIEYGNNAVFSWGQYAVPIILAMTDDLNNSGTYALANLLTTQMQNAEKALKDGIGTDLFSDGTAANSLTGLIAAVDDGTNVATYGGINRSTYTWWAAKYAANGGTGRQLTKYLIQNMMGRCSIDNERPTLLVTKQEVFDKVLLMEDPKQMFVNETLANANFTNFTYQGRPMVVDSHVTTPNSNHQIYFLNENWLHLYFHKDCNFKLDKFQKPFNQAVIGSFMYWRGQLITSSPRLQGRLVDIDPTL